MDHRQIVCALSLGAFVRHLLVAVAMASVMLVLSLLLAAPGVVTIPDDNLRDVLNESWVNVHGFPLPRLSLVG